MLRQKVIYFVPHQDDEVLTFGVDILRAIKQYDVKVVLCTDGSQSYVKELLNNHQKCDKHFGCHKYHLDIKEFVAARDKEFIGSCIKLGVNSSNIIIPDSRCKDGHLDYQQIDVILQNVMETEDVENINYIACIAPINSKKQHKDHFNLGIAVMKIAALYGVEIRLFIEPYCLKDMSVQNDYYKEEKPNIIDKIKLSEALHSYSIWKPKENRFAIGYHSVTTDFRDYHKKARSYMLYK